VVDAASSTGTVVSPATEWRRRLRIFATAPDEPRARRASDVTLLLTTSFALAAASAAASPTPVFVEALQRLAADVPHFLGALWQLTIDATALLALFLLVAAIVDRRGSLARDLVVAATVTVVVWTLIGRVTTDSWPDVWAAIRAAAPPSWYPSLRVALPAAVVITASPHVVRPLRNIGRWSISLTMVAVVVLGAASALGAIGGLLLAVAAGAAAHLVFGSSAGRPSLADVGAALTQLGIEPAELAVADRQPAGLFLVRGRTADGTAIDVKVYGRDAHDSAVQSTLWRKIWYRDPGAPLRVGRLQQVEHEAFVTLLAAQAGVPTDVVVTAGATIEDDVVLVLRPTGRSLLDVGDVGPGVVDQLWTLVSTLHAAGIAHGLIDPRHLLLTDDRRLGIRNFRGASAVLTAAQRSTDLVQALVTTVALVGPDDAVAAARRHLDEARLAALLPYLQPAVLTAQQRRDVTSAALDLPALRAALAATIGAEVPELQELRRVTLSTVVRVVLPAVAALFLLSMLAGLDAAALFDAVREASWWLLVVAFLAAQLPRVSQAVSTMGSAPVPLPLGPVYALQLAASYINVAIPSIAARVAINIRFFQRHGMPPGTAVAAGALDGVGGFVSQIVILAVLIVFTSPSLELDLGHAASGAGRLLAIVAVAVAVIAAVVVLTPKVRRFVIRWVRRLATEALVAIRGLRSPRRLAMLFGGNLATELLFAGALGLFVAALGHPIGIGALLLTNISVSLLAGLIPVPGGIGIAEGGLTFGLVQAGVPEEVAFAAVLLYRMATFYLPPIWGYAAMRWLERNDQL
jgi:uncharacterized membrane protein YbhN (UPF0104 family)